MKRRIISLVLVLSVLIGASMRPQRTEAVGVVTTAAGIAAIVSAVMAGCGVTYWASTQQNAVDYIGGKIDEYLTSIGGAYSDALEWLGADYVTDVFTIASRGTLGVTQVASNKILDFVTWLFGEEDIVSGGTAVSSGGWQVVRVNGSTTHGGYSVSASNDIITVVADQWYSEDTTIIMSAEVVANTSVSVEVLDSTLTGRYVPRYLITLTNDAEYVYSPGGLGHYVTNGGYYTANSNVDTQYIAISIGCQDWTSGQFSFIWRDAPAPETTITPSESVVVPPALEQGQSLIVTTSAPFAADASKDVAMQSILDTVVSEGGLSAETEASEGMTDGWDWLYQLLTDIATAISDGVAQLKQVVLGLADSIYSKFTTILQDIKSGITTIVNSITSAVSQLLSAIQALPTTIYSQFTQILQDIKTGIQGIVIDIYTDIINALTYVFVPSQAFIDTYVASLYDTFDNHFSILSYPFSILGEFITRASGIGSPEPMFTWGNIFEPFSGKLLIAAGSYNLNSMLSNQTFAQVYSIYMIVVKGLISFAFLKFLYSWFCDVFKMREDDFSSPLDVEVEDDTSDFDGYDGYYTS